MKGVGKTVRRNEAQRRWGDLERVVRDLIEGWEIQQRGQMERMEGNNREDFGDPEKNGGSSR